MTRTLRSACDRALSEQTALVRWLRCTQTHLHQWGEYANDFQGAVNNFGKRYRKSFDGTFTQLQKMSSVPVDLMSAMQVAERARIKSDVISGERAAQNSPRSSRGNIHDSDQGSRNLRDDTKKTSVNLVGKNSKDKSTSSPLLSPMEQLARGAYGIEVAALIQAIRLHVPSLASFHRTLQECIDILSQSMENEVQTLNRLQTRLLELTVLTRKADAELGNSSKTK